MARILRVREYTIMQNTELHLQDIFQQIMGLPVETFEILKKYWPDTIAVYMFYYYTAKWQGTNQPKCTVEYIAKWLGMTAERVRKARQKLLENTLIDDIQRKDSQGKITGVYVKINYSSTLTIFHSVDNHQTNPNILYNKMLNTKQEKKTIEQTIMDIPLSDKELFQFLFNEYSQKWIIHIDKLCPVIYLNEYTRESLEKLAIKFFDYWSEWDRYLNEASFKIQKRFRTFVVQDFTGVLKKKPVWKWLDNMTEDDFKHLKNQWYLAHPQCSFFLETVKPTLSEEELKKFSIIMDFINNYWVGPRKNYTLKQWLEIKIK